MNDLLLILCISVPHLLYAVVWFRPALWKSIFSVNPCQAFAQVATYLKVFQAACWIFWYVRVGPFMALSEISLVNVILAIALLCGGQALNVGVYKTIGRDGVYYGNKLGGKLGPWVTGFPFNVVPHPQYSGAVMSIWGVFLLTCMDPAHFLRGIVIMTAWTLFYAMSAFIESKC